MGKRTARLMAVVLGVCAATVGTAATTQPQSDRMGGIGITVFEDTRYRGGNATFRSDEPDLRGAKLANRISSLQVALGEVWEVCEGTNYRPPCQIFSGAEPDLRRRNWNDRISSLRRVQARRGSGAPPAGTGGVVLYSEEFFRGTERVITSGAPSLGAFDDKARSVRVFSGAWELCEDTGYRKCLAIDRDWANLKNVDLSGKVSSVRPAPGGQPGYQRQKASGPARLVMYERDRYRGASRTLDGASAALGGFGNRARSLRVTGRWQLCDGPNFTGRCVTVSQDVPDLAGYGMNSRVSSARPAGGR